MAIMIVIIRGTAVAATGDWIFDNLPSRVSGPDFDVPRPRVMIRAFRRLTAKARTK